MKDGKLENFDHERRFGWIQEPNGARWFCHLLDFNGRPVPPIGTPVRFEIGEFKGRKKATNIVVPTVQDVLGGTR